MYAVAGRFIGSINESNEIVIQRPLKMELTIDGTEWTNITRVIYVTDNCLDDYGIPEYNFTYQYENERVQNSNFTDGPAHCLGWNQVLHTETTSVRLVYTRLLIRMCYRGHSWGTKYPWHLFNWRK